jgi:class 3 adenylate cyclase
MALFCDLVGFTSRAEAMDPEDVAALLAPYHARLKDELERCEGTVEKFIGGSSPNGVVPRPTSSSRRRTPSIAPSARRATSARTRRFSPQPAS